jgi:hypothetical protein
MARPSSSHIHIPIGMYLLERADSSFGKEFTTAVEQKQIAQQDAERAKFVVEKAEQERQAAVIRAEGEAEAANTISKALNRAGDAFVQFRKIEAAREIGTFFLLPFLPPIFPPSSSLTSHTSSFTSSEWVVHYPAPFTLRYIIKLPPYSSSISELR